MLWWSVLIACRGGEDPNRADPTDLVGIWGYVQDRAVDLGGPDVVFVEIRETPEGVVLTDYAGVSGVLELDKGAMRVDGAPYAELTGIDRDAGTIEIRGTTYERSEDCMFAGQVNTTLFGAANLRAAFDADNRLHMVSPYTSHEHTRSGRCGVFAGLDVTGHAIAFGPDGMGWIADLQESTLQIHRFDPDAPEAGAETTFVGAGGIAAGIQTEVRLVFRPGQNEPVVVGPGGRNVFEYDGATWVPWSELDAGGGLLPWSMDAWTGPDGRIHVTDNSGLVRAEPFAGARVLEPWDVERPERGQIWSEMIAKYEHAPDGTLYGAWSIEQRRLGPATIYDIADWDRLVLGRYLPTEQTWETWFLGPGNPVDIGFDDDGVLHVATMTHRITATMGDVAITLDDQGRYASHTYTWAGKDFDVNAQNGYLSLLVDSANHFVPTGAVAPDGSAVVTGGHPVGFQPWWWRRDPAWPTWSTTPVRFSGDGQATAVFPDGTRCSSDCTVSLPSNAVVPIVLESEDLPRVSGAPWGGSHDLDHGWVAVIDPREATIDVEVDRTRLTVTDELEADAVLDIQPDGDGLLVMTQGCSAPGTHFQTGLQRRDASGAIVAETCAQVRGRTLNRDGDGWWLTHEDGFARVDAELNVTLAGSANTLPPPMQRDRQAWVDGQLAVLEGAALYATINRYDPHTGDVVHTVDFILDGNLVLAEAGLVRGDGGYVVLAAGDLWFVSDDGDIEQTLPAGAYANITRFGDVIHLLSDTAASSGVDLNGTQIPTQTKFHARLALDGTVLGWSETEIGAGRSAVLIPGPDALAVVDGGSALQIGVLTDEEDRFHRFWTVYGAVDVPNVQVPAIAAWRQDGTLVAGFTNALASNGLFLDYDRHRSYAIENEWRPYLGTVDTTP